MESITWPHVVYQEKEYQFLRKRKTFPHTKRSFSWAKQQKPARVFTGGPQGVCAAKGAYNKGNGSGLLSLGAPLTTISQTASVHSHKKNQPAPRLQPHQESLLREESEKSFSYLGTALFAQGQERSTLHWEDVWLKTVV